MNPVRFRRAAARDLAAARAWYERQREGLGSDVLHEVARVVEPIGSLPGQFPVVHRSIRRALLRRFPYALFFVEDVDAAVVLAVLHQAVDPARWKARLR